jgi:hypothetical protein
MLAPRHLNFDTVMMSISEQEQEMITQQSNTSSNGHSAQINNALLEGYEVGKMSPAQVRQTVAALVAEEKTEIAVALCEASLAVYPSEQDILAVCPSL